MLIANIWKLELRFSCHCFALEIVEVLAIWWLINWSESLINFYRVIRTWLIAANRKSVREKQIKNEWEKEFRCSPARRYCHQSENWKLPRSARKFCFHTIHKARPSWLCFISQGLMHLEHIKFSLRMEVSSTDNIHTHRAPHPAREKRRIYLSVSVHAEWS